MIDLLGFSLSKKLGWTEGRNIRIDTRWAAADIEAMQRFAKELVGSQPELIFSTNTPATATLQQTRTIPIVFWPSGRRARE